MTHPRFFGEAAKRRLDASIHRTRALLSSNRRRLRAYDALLSSAQRHGLFVTRGRAGEAPDVEAGILHLSAEHGAWVRSPYAWLPAVGSAWVRFASLAEHVLSIYPMPRFMASVWLDVDAAHADRRAWYRRLGQGEGLRRLGLPIRVTRAMAHRFQFAPDHLSAAGALRWAQLVELGAPPALVASVLATRLGRELQNEEFWETVVHFFVNHPELDVVHVGPIVDSLQHRRFERREGVTPSGRVGHLWTIRELCSTAALRAEGSAMRHCAASYVGACVRRRTSIWSVVRGRLDSALSRERVVRSGGGGGARSLR